MLCCLLISLNACTSQEEKYVYNITNKCVIDYISERYKARDEVPYIEIIESEDNCRQYFVSSIIYLSSIKNDPPCYYTTINNELVLVYTKNCSNRDRLDRISFFINQLKDTLEDDITEQPDIYINGDKLIKVKDFFHPSYVKISECEDANCTPVMVDKMP